MEKSQNKSSMDDTLLFAEEEKKKSPSPEVGKETFKLLIVDDENEIHVMTKLVLDDYQYLGRELEFISAFSGEEAKETITQTPDIACCLLDVVMETKDAGLEVARFIRDEIKNSKMRIVLRTGQPGKAPEKDIILNYDINDYKEKTELTTQKLFTTITTALRSYMHLLELDEKNKEIQSKNIRLNEEIARRIVAESNLTKYNRSLERMIESKTKRLKEALGSLEQTEKQLFVTQKAAIVSDLSALSLDTLDTSNTRIDQNLRKMNFYRQQMTFLLEKYNTLETIIATHQGKHQEIERAAQKNIIEIQTFKSEIDLEHILKRYPEIIRDSIEGIEQISKAIADIKMFISINDEKKTDLDLNAQLREIVERIQPSQQKIDIQLDLQNIPVLALPKQNFIKAMDAVLENALNAIEEHGIVSILTRYEDPMVHITISDIGMGIDKDILPKIFIPYFKGWKKGKKGIGLSFAKSVFLSCGGDISITSTVNEGTTVNLCLPAES